MAIVTFAQVKGGSGKTTAAMCTVAELVARGETVAALDLDPNRPLKAFFAKVPELTRVEVAVPDGERRVTALVRDLASKHNHVVIDLMGAATNDTQVAMALADLVIVPSQMSETDLRCGVETWRQAEEAQEISGRRIARGILVHGASARAFAKPAGGRGKPSAGTHCRTRRRCAAGLRARQRRAPNPSALGTVSRG